MAKKHHIDDSQPSLFDLIQHAQGIEAAPSSEGSLNIQDRLRRSLSDGIKQSPLSVHIIAGEMSHLLGETITAEMIYSWTAESKSNHQIWGSRLPAFCRAARWRQPLEIMTRAAGAFCLPGPEALRAEIQRMREEERILATERRKREIFLKELENQ
ncbi:MAG TPA: hypothetical protein PK587_06800 [Syntrophales bacterium]|mgnify:FL=1|nr:hypothetical protein [Syntrophales bacterium]